MPFLCAHAITNWACRAASMLKWKISAPTRHAGLQAAQWQITLEHFKYANKNFIAHVSTAHLCWSVSLARAGKTKQTNCTKSAQAIGSYMWDRAWASKPWSSAATFEYLPARKWIAQEDSWSCSKLRIALTCSTAQPSEWPPTQLQLACCQSACPCGPQRMRPEWHGASLYPPDHPEQAWTRWCTSMAQARSRSGSTPARLHSGPTRNLDTTKEVHSFLHFHYGMWQPKHSKNNQWLVVAVAGCSLVSSYDHHPPHHHHQHHHYHHHYQHLIIIIMIVNT